MTRRRLPSVLRARRAIVIALVISFVVPVSAGGAGFAQPGAIEGTVTAAPGKNRVAGIEVCASASVEGEWFTQCEESKGNGSYEVIGLPEAIYRVRFSRGESGMNLATEYWRNVTNPNAAKLLQVNEGQTIQNINAELQPKSSKTPKGPTNNGNAGPRK